MGENEKAFNGGNAGPSSTSGAKPSPYFDTTADEERELRDVIDKFRDATGDLEGAITKAKRELKELKLLRDRQIKDEAKIRELEREISDLSARLKTATVAMDTFPTDRPSAPDEHTQPTPPPQADSALFRAAVDRLNVLVESLRTAPNPLQQEVDRLNALVASLQNGQSVYSRVLSQDVEKIKNDAHRSFWNNTFSGIYNNDYAPLLWKTYTKEDLQKVIEKMSNAVRYAINDDLN